MRQSSAGAPASLPPLFLPVASSWGCTGHTSVLLQQQQGVGEAADGEGDGATALGVPPHPASGLPGYSRCWAPQLIHAQQTSQSRDAPCPMCRLCFSCTPRSARPWACPVLHGSHSSLQLQPYTANRQVLASISEAFIIGPSWLVVTRLAVEQLSSNAVRHPLVA